MKKLLQTCGLGCCLYLCLFAAQAQPNISRVEYYIDADPGYGNGTAISFPAGNNLVDKTFNINPTTLTSGVHIVGVRALDATGRWSYDYRWLVIKPYANLEGPGSLGNITRVEYYIDTDPGYGNGTAITITPGTNLNDRTFNINPTALSAGVHIIGLRARDANGNWSHDNRWLIVKPYPNLEGPGTLGNITRVEYYIDDDPGFGNATPVTITPGTNLSDIQLNINSGALTAGEHVLGIRSMDANGNWGHDNIWEFEVSSTLPVDLMNFGASYKEGSVLLDWKTVSELNASHFIVERSANGVIFNAIGKVDASGNSDVIKQYAFVDKEALHIGADKLYYRLQQVDADGKFEYSKIVSVLLPEAALFAIMPNPASNYLEVRYKSLQALSTAVLQVIDMSGKKVLEEKMNLQASKHTINIAHLPKGTYTLSITEGANKLSRRFVKQ